MKLKGLWLEVPVDRAWHLGRVPGILTDLEGELKDIWEAQEGRTMEKTSPFLS